MLTHLSTSNEACSRKPRPPGGLRRRGRLLRCASSEMEGVAFVGTPRICSSRTQRGPRDFRLGLLARLHHFFPGNFAPTIDGHLAKDRCECAFRRAYPDVLRLALCHAPQELLQSIHGDVVSDFSVTGPLPVLIVQYSRAVSITPLSPMYRSRFDRKNFGVICEPINVNWTLFGVIIRDAQMIEQVPTLFHGAAAGADCLQRMPRRETS